MIKDLNPVWAEILDVGRTKCPCICFCFGGSVPVRAYKFWASRLMLLWLVGWTTSFLFLGRSILYHVRVFITCASVLIICCAQTKCVRTMRFTTSFSSIYLTWTTAAPRPSDDDPTNHIKDVATAVAAARPPLPIHWLSTKSSWIWCVSVNQVVLYTTCARMRPPTSPPPTGRRWY